MKLITCLFICCATGIVHTTSSDVETDERFDAILIRIDQLEARDRLHQMEIEKLRHEQETEVDKLRHDHQAELDRLRHDVTRLEATVQRQDDTIKAMLNAPNDGTTHKEQAETNQNSPAPERNQRSAISRNRIRRSENDVDVAFFATLSALTQHIGQNQPVVFDHVITNNGNSYNPHVGVFLAPVAGTYVFSVSLTTKDRDQAHYGIFRNLEQLTVLWLNGLENEWDTTSQTAVIHLAKGDDVTIKHIETDHALNGNRHCLFSGFLLSQDFTDSSPIVGK